MKAKTILILVNHELVIYNFRKELVERLLSDGYKVYISSPTGLKTDRLKKMGATILPIKINRHSKNPFSDLRLLFNYLKTIKEIKPDIVLTYTIKPNIYGGLACRILKIKYITTITGLGAALDQGIKSVIPNMLYRVSLKKAVRVIFQNQFNLEYMKKKRIVRHNVEVVNGSGVNIDEYEYHNYPSSETIHIVFVGRIMKEKGIDDYLQLSRDLKPSYPHVTFHIIGALEEDYTDIINEHIEKKLIEYHGSVQTALPFYQMAHAIVHPTRYHEGISNVLLEAASTGRPMIAPKVAGCLEVIQNGISGFLYPSKNYEELLKITKSFLDLSHTQKTKMGIAAHKYISKYFNRKTVIEKYMNLIENSLND